MGTTTFSGPIKAGDIFDTSGTTLGKDVKNVGSAELGQSAVVTQTVGFSTDVVIPAGSLIVGIDMLITSVWDGAAATFNVGTTNGGSELVSGASGATLGRLITGPGGATRTALWANIGPDDQRIWISSANAGGGKGVLVVRYLQAQGVAL